MPWKDPFVDSPIIALLEVKLRAAQLDLLTQLQGVEHLARTLSLPVDLADARRALLELTDD